MPHEFLCFHYGVNKHTLVQIPMVYNPTGFKRACHWKPEFTYTCGKGILQIKEALSSKF
jgi:hypothetical protein